MQILFMEDLIYESTGQFIYIWDKEFVHRYKESLFGIDILSELLRSSQNR